MHTIQLFTVRKAALLTSLQAWDEDVKGWRITGQIYVVPGDEADTRRVTDKFRTMLVRLGAAQVDIRETSTPPRETG